jgi:uncharacterized membrane protein
MTTGTSMFAVIIPVKRTAHDPRGSTELRPVRKPSIPMRRTIAKAVTWRLIGTTEIFAISFWTTGHITTAGHTAAIAAITSVVMYVAHELAWESRRDQAASSKRDVRAGEGPDLTIFPQSTVYMG